jgi:sec-independent protein translocase protein TatB
MFDVGFAEILLLSLVGLLVLGPERLPRVARTLGGLARKARSSWLNLKRSIEAEVRAEELKEPLKHFEKEVKSTVDDVRSGVNSIRNFDPLKPDSATKPGETDDGD